MFAVHSRITVLVVALVSICGATQVSLEAYATAFDTVPIAVVPFESRGASRLTSNEPWVVIAADLSFSPRFKVHRASKPDSAKLLDKGIGIYVDGEYTIEGQHVVLECFLRDARNGQELLGKKLRGETKYVRSMAHRFANDIIEALLGERSVFESRMLFVRKHGDTKDLYIMDYDGHGTKRLTNTKTVNVFPAFADGNTIVWTSFLRGKPDLYKGSVSTGGSGIFIYSRFVTTSPAVNAIEGKIAYASSKPGNLEIFTADIDGTNVQQLTFRGGIDTSPCWSPTGYQIAFTSDRSGQPQIYVMDADGTNTRRLTFNGSYQDSPSWSPRGDRIAYASYQNGRFEIWTIAPDGSDPKCVVSGSGHNEYPSWSPDGLHIAFMRRTAGGNDVYVVRHDGTDVRRLTNSGDAGMPDWGPFN